MTLQYGPDIKMKIHTCIPVHVYVCMYMCIVFLYMCMHSCTCVLYSCTHVKFYMFHDNLIT